MKSINPFPTSENITQVGLLPKKYNPKEIEPRILELWNIGVSMKWEDPYMSLKPEYVEAAWWLVKRACERGLLKKGLKVVWWCSRCKTVLADYEVIILLIEALTILAWYLAPEIVLLNYIVNVLGLTLFEVMVVEAAISVGAILATYISERIESKYRFDIIALGYTLIAAWALIMFLKPPFMFVVLAYFMCRFGKTLSFPFYRSWLFSKNTS